MLKLFLNTKSAVRLAYSSRVCFGVMRDQNSNNPHNKEQQEQPDDYESTAECNNQLPSAYKFTLLQLTTIQRNYFSRK